MSAPLWGEEVVWALAKGAIGFFTWASLFILQPLFYTSSWIGPVLQGTKLNSKGTHLPISHSLWRYRQTETDDYNAMRRQGGRDRPRNDGTRQRQGPADPWWPMAGATLFSSSSQQEYVQVFILPTVLKTTANIFCFNSVFIFIKMFKLWHVSSIYQNTENDILEAQGWFCVTVGSTGSRAECLRSVPALPPADGWRKQRALL